MSSSTIGYKDVFIFSKKVFFFLFINIFLLKIIKWKVIFILSSLLLSFLDLLGPETFTQAMQQWRSISTLLKPISQSSHTEGLSTSLWYITWQKYVKTYLKQHRLPFYHTPKQMKVRKWLNTLLLHDHVLQQAKLKGNLLQLHHKPPI